MVCASTKTARPRVSNGRFLHADQVGPFSRFRLAVEREGSDWNLRIQPHLPQQSNCSDEAANRKATTLPLVGTLQFPFGIIYPGGESERGPREGARETRDWLDWERARARERSSRARPSAASFNC